jgi:pimeloyl-ACP methyl ester carboxylesterase
MPSPWPLRLVTLVLLASSIIRSAEAAAELRGDLPRRAELGFATRASDEGLAVREVTAGSPAATAGLRAGDHLLAVQGRSFDKAHVGRDLLRRLDGGVPARLAVLREGRRLDVSFTPRAAPLEELPGVDTVYGVLEDAGARLRTVVTRPSGAKGRLPAVLLTQWVSCDGVEPLDGDAWGQVLRGIVTRSGAQVIRVDRSSGGDSEGPGCHELDYDTEVAQYRAAFERLTRDDGVDSSKIVVFGMSLGSTTAPLVALGQRVAGVAVSGGGAFTYFERMLAFDRLGYELGDTPAADIDGFVRQSAAFHAEYLLRGKTPAQIAAERPELASVWARIRGTGDGHHYGRPLAWHQQAAGKDFLAAWARIDAPVLVVYGEYDQFEPPPAHRVIADTVNRLRPGTAGAVEVPRMNHFYRVFANPKDAAANEPGHDAPELALSPLLEWLRKDVGFPPPAAGR